MVGEVTVSVAGEEGNASMQFDSLSELAQLLKLAGVAQKEPIATDQNGAFDVDVDDEGMISMPTCENADFDYGLNPTSRKGYVYPADPYKYQGDAEIDVRYTPARMADNPLRQIRETKSLGVYLQEVENRMSEWAETARKGALKKAGMAKTG